MYNLFLDDNRNVFSVYKYTKNSIYIDNDWVIVRNYNDFVNTIIQNGLPNIISFDHDLSDKKYILRLDKNEDYSNYREKTGFECAKWLVNYCLDNNLNFPEYYVHSFNPIGKENIISYIENFKRTRWFSSSFLFF